jgi:hypothetical protein
MGAFEKPRFRNWADATSGSTVKKILVLPQVVHVQLKTCNQAHL